jgi:hypothetical protein
MAGGPFAAFGAGATGVARLVDALLFRAAPTTFQSWLSNYQQERLTAV